MQRERWSSRLGFFLAAVGSAVGLGNMWRFSYLTAENGGGAFVLLYVLFVFLVGLPVLLAELAIGRGTRRSPVGALAELGGSAWPALGGLFVLSGFLILAYYSVIAGWTLRYVFDLATSGLPADAGAYFDGIVDGGRAVGWHLGFMLLTVATVLGGVRRGIERLALVLMPALFVMLAGLAAYAATLDGAAEGYRFYLAPDFAQLGNADVLTAAASQAFFSLSLGMGAMLTYGSYLSDDAPLPRQALSIAGADFGVALVAGLAVFPMIFAFGLSDQIGGSAVGALFVTLPRAFEEMGAVVGTAVGLLFFVALAIAALTSAISLLEVVVATSMDALGWPRRGATLAAGGLIAAVGILPALSVDSLSLMDRLAGELFLVFGGLLLAVFAGWFARSPREAGEREAPGELWRGSWKWLLRLPVPLVLAYVLVRFAQNLF
ncbi:MAG: sodium-dependent transporter [Proteobacteria bacterium]|nr:sodium-dependent transporter [Pseudomonadota bacterium]